MTIRVFKPKIHVGMEDEFELFLRDTAIPNV